MVFSMLKNWNYRYYSHNNIIKFVSFKLIYYALNLIVVSSFIIFRKFVYVFLSIYSYFESMKLFSFYIIK